MKITIDLKAMSEAQRNPNWKFVGVQRFEEFNLGWFLRPIFALAAVFP
jgi:hypothetical protein